MWKTEPVVASITSQSTGPFPVWGPTSKMTSISGASFGPLWYFTALKLHPGGLFPCANTGVERSEIGPNKRSSRSRLDIWFGSVRDGCFQLPNRRTRSHSREGIVRKSKVFLRHHAGDRGVELGDLLRANDSLYLESEERR